MTAHAFALLLAFTWAPAVALAAWVGYRVGRVDGRLSGSREMYDHAARILESGRDWRAP